MGRPSFSLSLSSPTIIIIHGKSWLLPLEPPKLDGFRKGFARTITSSAIALFAASESFLFSEGNSFLNSLYGGLKNKDYFFRKIKIIFFFVIIFCRDVELRSLEPWPGNGSFFFFLPPQIITIAITFLSADLLILMMIG